jgi:LacI family transcriptional regulator, gluconate utilization system Gnt-I transcriptional repressor
MTQPHNPSQRKARRPTRQGQSSTLKDVADLAGVSQMTASRALKKPETVSLKLRQRVEKAILELDYIPDHVAVHLAGGTSGIIPFLIPTLNHNIYIPTLNAMTDDLSQAGYQILLSTTEYDMNHEESIIRNLLGWRPAGIVVSGIDHTERTRKLLQGLQQPVIEIMDLASNPIDLNVGFDHAAVGVAIAKEFIQRGRKQIGYIGTLTRKDSYSGRRINAFSKTLMEANLPSNLIARSDKPNSIAVGAELFRQLLEQNPSLDAVFLATDDLAVGALVEAQRLGKRIPEDISIIGFNDQDIAAYFNPAISSVRTPRIEMGHIAARMLLARLQGKTLDTCRVDVGFEIIHRATTDSSN